MPDDAHPPLTAVNLDSLSLRRLSLQIHSEGDHLATLAKRVHAEADALVEAVERDREGSITAQEAPLVIQDCIDRLIEIVRHLGPIRAMAAEHAKREALAQLADRNRA